MNVLVSRLTLVCVSLMVILPSIGDAKIDPKTIVGLWLFNEGKGDVAKDSSDNRNDGTLVNSPKWAKKGKFSNALEFDGQNNYVSASDESLPMEDQPRTLVAWTKPASSFNGFAIYYGTTGAPWFGCVYLGIYDIGQGFKAAIIGTCGGGSNVGGTSALDDGKWRHLAATFDGDTWSFYVDGSLESTGSSPTNTVSREELRIGLSEEDDQGFHGVIDEVAIFNVALTLDDIKSVMTEGLSSITAVSPSGKLAATWGRLKK